MTFALSELPAMNENARQSLLGVGIEFPADMLRTNRKLIASKIAGVTAKQVADWQAFCSLMEIKGISVEIAKALASSNVHFIDHFSNMKLGQVMTLLTGVVPSPTADQISEWQKDATALCLLGVINGTVVDNNLMPLSGASVVVNGKTLITDLRGRFRALRISLCQKQVITVTHPEKRRKIIKGVSAHPSAALVGIQIMLNGKPSALPKLSALSGDVLPPLGAAPITTAAQTGNPSSQDILRVVDKYANGDIRLASLFYDFSNGKFEIRTYRAQMTMFRSGFDVGSHVGFDGSMYFKVLSSPQKIKAISKARKIKLTYYKNVNKYKSESEKKKLSRKLLNVLINSKLSK